MYIKKFSGILISALGFLLAGSALGKPIDSALVGLDPRIQILGSGPDLTCFTSDYPITNASIKLTDRHTGKLIYLTCLGNFDAKSRYALRFKAPQSYRQLTFNPHEVTFKYRPENLQQFKLQPRANLWGFTGDYTRGEGQLMMPFYGNQTRAFYGVFDGNVAVNDTDWLAGAGLGYRQVVKSFILGAYAIADYQHSAQNNEFWIANPGLEMLGTKWDANINGYLPFAKKKNIHIIEATAEELGIYQYERLTGHNVFDHRLQILGGTTPGSFGEEAGRGLDLEIGRVIPHVEQMRMYVGGYHFDSDDAGSTNGLEARLVYEFNKYVAFEAEENYDNKNHNVFVAGLRFSLGGYSAQEKAALGISTRLMDPIEHDFVVGALGAVNPMPVQKTIDLGEVLVHDNVWFFKPLTTGVSVNDIGPGIPVGFGTAESPFIGFTPENYQVVYGNRFLGKIDAFPLMYFAPGAYNFNGGPSSPAESIGFEGTNRFNLPNGWGMYGRTSGYLQPALGDDRATFNGGLDMNYDVDFGNAQTTLSSVKVINDIGATSGGNYDNAGLHAENAKKINLQDVDIENNFTNSDGSAYAYGIYANHSTVEFFNGINTVSGSGSSSSSGSGSGFGIYADNSTIEFFNGTNTVSGFGDDFGFDVGYGIYADNSTVEFYNGTNAVSGFGDDYGQAIYANNSAVEFFNGTNTVSGSSYDGFGYGFGIYANNSTIEFYNGTNTVSGFGSGYGHGIYANNNSTIEFSNGTNTVSAFGNSNSYGIYMAGSSLGNAIVNFGNNNSPKVVISVSGGLRQDGIYSENSYTSIIANGTPLTANASILQDYVSLTKTGSGAFGNAVTWYFGGVQTSPWSDW